MARFLSEEWFSQARAALPAAPDADGPDADGPDADGPDADGPDADGPDADGPDADGPGDATVTVRHRVTGGPDGDVDYLVRAGPRSWSIEPGGGGPADIEIIEGYDSAAAISQGRITPAEAFAAGRLKLAGDVALLADHQDDLAALGVLLAPVRAATTY